MKGLWVLFKQDMLLTYRRGHEWAQPLLFLLMVASLFPLSVSADPNLLARIGPGVIWVGILLAIFLGEAQLFKSDHEEGALVSWILSSHPLSLLVGCRLLAHFILNVLPIIIATPLLGLWFHLNGQVILALMGSLLLGAPILILLGGVASALVVGLRNSGFLITLILLPLTIPVLIGGVGVVDVVARGGSPLAIFATLGAFLIMLIPIGPVIAGAALRLGI